MPANPAPKGKQKAVEKKKREDRIRQSEELRQSITPYSRLMVLHLSSNRAEVMNELRRRFNTSVLSLAKRSVICFALGMNEQDALAPGTNQLGEYLSTTGAAALLATNETPDDVDGFLRGIDITTWAMSGDISPESFSLAAGPLSEIPHSMCTYLRELGLPVQLEHGIVTLTQDVVVARAGEPLGKSACGILKVFGRQLGRFTARLVAVWEGGMITTA